MRAVRQRLDIRLARLINVLIQHSGHSGCIGGPGDGLFHLQHDLGQCRSRILRVALQNASWAGIMAPAGTPEELVKVLSDAMETAVADPGYVKVIEDGNQIPTFRDYQETAELIQSEADRYGPWIEMAQQDQ